MKIWEIIRYLNFDSTNSLLKMDLGVDSKALSHVCGKAQVRPKTLSLNSSESRLTQYIFRQIMPSSRDTIDSRNTQIHRETNTPTLKDFITTLTLNFHSRLPLATGAIYYNIGQTSFSPTFETMAITGLTKLMTKLNNT
jgi:hypothetical protein